MPKGHWVGVDIGTYSSKGVIVREDGIVVASHIIAHDLEMPRPGFFEHDAERIWWHDFVEIVHSLLQKSGLDPKQIIGIGASAIGSCVLPLDESGQPLRPAILYGIDTRASDEIAFLERELGRDTIFERSGMHLSSQASGPKILWIRNHEPEIFQKTRWFLTSQAYLVYKLTGQASIDVYTAGGYIPLYNVFQRKWVNDAANMITTLEFLPKVYWSAEIVGRVTAGAARVVGLAEGTPVVAGTTDAASEALSAGVADIGDMMLMFGSSIFFILKTAALLRNAALLEFQFSRRRYVCLYWRHVDGRKPDHLVPRSVCPKGNGAGKKGSWKRLYSIGSGSFCRSHRLERADCPTVLRGRAHAIARSQGERGMVRFESEAYPGRPVPGNFRRSGLWYTP